MGTESKLPKPPLRRWRVVCQATVTCSVDIDARSGADAIDRAQHMDDLEWDYDHDGEPNFTEATAEEIGDPEGDADA